MDFSNIPRADDLLKYYDLFSAPVNISLLAKNLDLKISFENIPIDLRFSKIGGNSSIVVGNKSTTENRKRFSIAHGIGHHVLSHNLKEVIFPYDDFSENRSDESDDEKLANAYAINLLIPIELLNFYGKRYMWSIEALSEKFMASKYLMLIQLGRRGF
jgi:Zn-dependent peptidase ImmA (M78 family)